MSALHVGYLTGEYPRATDTWIQREIAAHRRRGVEVTTFSIRRPGPEHLVGPEQREGQATTTYLLEQISPARLLTEHVKRFAASPRRYVETLRLAWRTKRPGIRGAVYQLFYFAEAVVLAAEVRRRRIDHLHNHFGDSSCSVAMLASELGGFPFSFTLHGHAIFFEAHAWRLDEKIRRSAFTACISHFCRSQAAIFAPDCTDKLHIVHCGIEPDRLTPVNHAGPGLRLLFVGRIATGKGIELLIDSVARLRERHEDLRLTVVGDGPQRESLERLSRQRSLADNITFVGSKNQDEVAKLLIDHDIFVLPSFAEGVPVVLMEAMGAGLPVVATQVGGMTELVDDNISGFLIRPFDTDQLTERIERLIGDADLRDRMGKAGRSTVLAEFVSADEAARLARLITDHRLGVESAVRPELPSAVDQN